MEPNPYRVLQVDPQAEPEVIDAAFRRLARKYHPDVNPAPEAAAQMAQIVAAYELLRDPDRRAAHDRSLETLQRSQPSGAHSDAGADGDSGGDWDSRAEEGMSLSVLGSLIGFDVKRRRRSS